MELHAHRANFPEEYDDPSDNIAELPEEEPEPEASQAPVDAWGCVTGTNETADTGATTAANECSDSGTQEKQEQWGTREQVKEQQEQHETQVAATSNW
jgi:hypothetical protein